MAKEKKVLMGFRLPGEAVGEIEKALQRSGVDTTLSAIMQVHVTNMANELRRVKTLEEKKEVIYRFLNYKLV